MNQRLRYVQVDAFAEQPFAGNPAAVMTLDAWPDDRTMQAIAEENNLAETAFLVPKTASSDADYELRWFTPKVEVDLCGHATLASGHVLLTDDAERSKVRFATRRSGVLEVRRTADGYELDLPSLPPTPCGVFAFEEHLGKGSIAWAEYDGYAIFVYASEAEIRALDPDFRALGRAGNLLTIATATPGSDTDIVSRVFAPGAGIDEDPVTGSAHAALVPFWAARLGRTSFTAFQASPRGGRLDCRLEGDRVVLGGRCTTVIEGSFLL